MCPYIIFVDLLHVGTMTCLTAQGHPCLKMDINHASAVQELPHCRDLAGLGPIHLQNGLALLGEILSRLVIKICNLLPKLPFYFSM